MAANAGASKAVCRIGYGMAALKKTTTTSAATPERTRSEASLLSRRERRKRNPQAMPDRNSGNRARGLNFKAFSQKAPRTSAFTIDKRSGFRTTSEPEKTRDVNQDTAAMSNNCGCERRTRTSSKNGNKT